MKIAIYQPVGFNETGGRSNNEDCIYPSPGMAVISDTLFLVCDGVGGEHKGEIASALACHCISQYFSEFPETDVNLEYVKKALEFTIQAFENTEKEDVDTHGMATTMTLLNLTDSGIAVAHLGDSRIYQIRNGKIIFKTDDHKWVNELIKGGLITEEQAKVHPKRNVITRVISAGRNDEPEFKLIEDVKSGDYFFMCTDGVLEQLYDGLLEYHLRDNHDNQASLAQIISAIKEECEGKTNDNFSAYLIKIESVSATGGLAFADEKTFNPVRAVSSNSVHENKPVKDDGGKSRGIIYTIALLVGLIFFGGLAYYYKQKQALKITEKKTISDDLDNGPKAELMIPKEVENVKSGKKKSEKILHPVKEISKNRDKDKKDNSSENTNSKKDKNHIITKTEIEKDVVKKDSSANFPLTVADEKKETFEKENKPAVIKTETPVLPKKEVQNLPVNVDPKMKE